MLPTYLDALARDLESRERYAEAAELRSRCGVVVSVESGRAAREAETEGDWRRWAELLSGSVSAA